MVTICFHASTGGRSANADTNTPHRTPSCSCDNAPSCTAASLEGSSSQKESTPIARASDTHAFTSVNVPGGTNRPTMTQSCVMTAITLELHVPDLDSASSFYSALGFETVWRSRTPGSQYMVMRLGDTPLSFDAWEKPHGYFGEDVAARGRGVEVVVAVTDLEEMYRRAN